MPASLPEARVGFPQDFEHCRRMIKAGSKSFHFASLMLPADIRKAAFATYAFCRLADDEIDLGSDPAAALDRLSERLDRIYSDAPEDGPIDRAFCHVVRTYDLPRALPEALLEGMRWDCEGRTYQTLDDLLDYAARVAGSVGAMMTVLMGNRSSIAAARACDLGLAMQLTNIARDVGEDALAGRLYLPLDWMAEAGIDQDVFLGRPSCTAGVRKVVKRLLDTAEPLYERGLSGVSLLPGSCQASIMAAGRIYREIGHEIRRNNYDSISQRAVVSKTRKMQLLAGAVTATRQPSSNSAAAYAAQYLVSAVAGSGRLEAAPIPPTRFNWTLDLFMRLSERERTA